MYDSPAIVLQLLKGNKLHVLITLFCLQLPTSEIQVAAMSGLNRKTARATLNQLVALGLVLRSGSTRSPWDLTATALQLPLPLRQLQGNHIGTPVLPDVVEPSPLLEPKKQAAPHNPGLIHAFQEAGIGRNMWLELAGYSWITPEYVTAHARAVRQRGESVGLLVHCLREHDPMPIFNEQNVCPDCGNRLFGNECLICSGVIET